MNDLISVIESIGFPIFISLYLLIRFEKKFDELNATILALHDVILELSHDEHNN